MRMEAGFTLIETLVVVVMVGVLAAIAAPSWLGFVARQRVNKANDAVLGALQEAQQLAKKNKINYSVSFKNIDNIPKAAIHAGYTMPSDDKDARWKRLLGEDVDALKSRQVLIYTNTDSDEANKTTSSSINFTAPGSGTITFDYMGVVANQKDGSTAPNTPLRIAVAAPNSGTSTSASSLTRCVIVDTLIGGMRIERNQSDCNRVN